MHEAQFPPSSLATEALLRWAGEFNEHLNQCAQCRQNPYGLCVAGEKILKGMPKD